MTGASQTLRQRTLWDSMNATSSLALRAGDLPCNLQDGHRAEACGPEAVRASRSLALAKDSGPPTLAIYGPTFADSSRSANLQRSLENRLRQRLDVNGSPEYVLTWKHWGMPSGVPICALRASARRISAKGCSGWPTPAVQNGEGGPNSNGNTGEHFTLQTAAALTGWPTPDAQSFGVSDSRWQERREEVKAKGINGNGFGMTLGMAATLTAGWATPTTRDWKGGDCSNANVPVNGLLARQVTGTGQTASSSRAEMEKHGVLSPDLPRWLMGYPDVWLSCVDWETLSSRKSQPNSSKRSSKRSSQ